jgi:Flp pilus assembly protein TadG
MPETAGKCLLPLIFHRGHFARCQNGVTAIEFALIAPVLIMIMMGIIEFSLIMFTSSVMEGATNETARLGKTGYVATGLTRQQEITNTITSKTSGLLNPTRITITTTVYSNFNNIGKPEPCLSPTTPPCPGTPGINFVDVNGNGVWDTDMGQAGLGNAGDIVVYSVSYPWPIFTPVIQAIFGTTYTITARSVVRNEPY